jgi:hypothetical protein
VNDDPYISGGIPCSTINISKIAPQGIKRNRLFSTKYTGEFSTSFVSLKDSFVTNTPRGWPTFCRGIHSTSKRYDSWWRNSRMFEKFQIVFYGTRRCCKKSLDTVLLKYALHIQEFLMIQIYYIINQ